MQQQGSGATPAVIPALASVGYDIDLSTGDFDLDAAGDIAKVFGLDVVNQSLSIMSTVNRNTLLFHPEWGIGAGSLVGGPFDTNAPAVIGEAVSSGYVADPAVVSVVEVSVTPPVQGRVTIVPVVQLVGGLTPTFTISVPIAGNN